MNEPPIDQENAWQFLKGLRNEEAQAKYIYQWYYEKAAAHVRKNAGTDEDARDLFQDVAVVLIAKLRDKDFQLKETFESYMYGITKNRWLMHLRKRRQLPPAASEPEDQPAEESGKNNEEAKWLFLSRIMDKLGADCQTLLKSFYFEKKQLREIAESMNHGEGYIRVKKGRCMEQLYTLAKRESDYEDFF